MLARTTWRVALAGAAFVTALLLPTHAAMASAASQGAKTFMVISILFAEEATRSLSP